jgi:glutamyl-tRNA synthetase
MPVTVRFAPSPTGLMHVGLARTALFNWLFARRHSGRFILRIEDTDRARCKPEYIQDYLESLRWLGLNWNEGPYIQSERIELYQQHAQRLLDEGKTYRCYCTPERLEEMRREQQLRKQPPGYDRFCRGLSKERRTALEASGAASVVRFAMPLEGSTEFEDQIRGRIQFDNTTLDDFVILKSDGFPTYHLASVVDDHLMNITHILRGEEWISSTPRHILLYRAFAWSPPLFAHLPLILGKDRTKLSKRHGAASLAEYREQGYLPDALANYVALLGWSPGGDHEVLSRAEMIERFDFSAINPAPAIFDLDKLDWMNGVYIRALESERLGELALPFLQRAGLVAQQASREQHEYAGKVLSLEQERMKRLSDAPLLASFFFVESVDYDERAVNKWLKRDYVPGVLQVLLERFSAMQPWDSASIEAEVRGLADKENRKASELIHPVRVAATGRTEGPGLFETLELIGRERVISRLRAALSLAGPANER